MVTAHKIHMSSTATTSEGGGLPATSQPTLWSVKAPGSPRGIRHHAGKTLPRSLNLHRNWLVYLQRPTIPLNPSFKGMRNRMQSS